MMPTQIVKRTFQHPPGRQVEQVCRQQPVTAPVRASTENCRRCFAHGTFRITCEPGFSPLAFTVKGRFCWWVESFGGGGPCGAALRVHVGKAERRSHRFPTSHPRSSAPLCRPWASPPAVTAKIRSVQIMSIRRSTASSLSDCSRPCNCGGFFPGGATPLQLQPMEFREDVWVDTPRDSPRSPAFRSDYLCGRVKGLPLRRNLKQIHQLGGAGINGRAGIVCGSRLEGDFSGVCDPHHIISYHIIYQFIRGSDEHLW